ncbi:LOW QUALITY PROTEIN: TM2 domain-containing protein 3 [Brienomyrus brachyistius]|uniref:LOW QUALITY PROTEIN: TM2 domain-containing protein 3 n=1 Tax=Brienomyrus brachyistius TaxID=42636 RepID=UPI0020B2517D|nr:LOW QUALITY PROTEIN: TM2 domain-containing protein 3 [Brienomyrus brachyistius]
MAAACQARLSLQGRCAMKAYAIMLLVFLDLCLKSVNGYLSSPPVSQEPPSSQVAQQSPVITSPVTPSSVPTTTPAVTSYVFKCPSRGLCSKLPPDCVNCTYHTNCTYGKPASFSCTAKSGVHCLGESGQRQTSFNLNVTCQFCWQLDPSQYRCSNSNNCMTVSCPRKRYTATCTVMEHVHCIGNREFSKRLFCNWTGGYKWSTALALSITLGGFGADRFYLGQWREGLGKLFSFGGLGIWTLIDVLLIGVGYVGPADGSLYI